MTGNVQFELTLEQPNLEINLALIGTESILWYETDHIEGASIRRDIHEVQQC